jgi:DNA invertase Pin-like site-specific DNA recombinase
VTRLDRLARLGDAWADTTTSHGRLMLTVLGGLAEFERDLIRTRTGEGRERAKARGVKMGRPHKLTPHQRQEILRRKENGEAVREIASTTARFHGCRTIDAVTFLERTKGLRRPPNGRINVSDKPY